MRPTWCWHRGILEKGVAFDAGRKGAGVKNCRMGASQFCLLVDKPIDHA